MQGTEDQVSGFSGGHCHGDGFQVAHLTDKNDIGVLT